MHCIDRNNCGLLVNKMGEANGADSWHKTHVTRSLCHCFDIATDAMRYVFEFSNLSILLLTIMTSYFAVVKEKSI